MGKGAEQGEGHLEHRWKRDRQTWQQTQEQKDSGLEKK